jgi:hypothetical protein
MASETDMVIETILTFFLYLGNATLVTILIQQATQFPKRIDRLTLLAIAVLIPSLLAGLRDLSVGTDTAMYAENLFASRYDVIVSRTNEMEGGYVLLNRAISFLGMSPMSLFFVMQFLTMSFFVAALWKLRKQIPVWLSVMMYMLLYFQTSFNMLRQALSVTICLYAFTLLPKKNLTFCFWVVLAAQFHISAYICLGALVLPWLLQNHRNLAYCLLFCLFILVMDREILGNLITSITGSPYYAGYILADVNNLGGEMGSWVGYVARIAPYILLCLVAYKRIVRSRQIRLLFYLLLAGWIIASLGRITATGIQRIGFYFTYCLVFVAPFATMSFVPRERKLFQAGLLGFVGFHWLYDSFYRGFGSTVPYHTIFWR